MAPTMVSRRDVVSAGMGIVAGLTTLSHAAQAREKGPDGIAAVLDHYDALGMAELVARKQVTPQELLEAAITRAEALNPSYNFLAQKMYDYGRAQSTRALPRGPFAGVPWLLKDLNTHVSGYPTAQGSRFYKGYVATVTSELVRRHEQAGFVIFGKTTCPEFGLTATTESLAYGATRNPWNPEVTAGGSSGGAAVAVAAGIVPAAHATDGGGSIRIPASCCGLFGLKPSRGRVPMGPLRTEGWGGLSTHHAMTWTVRDSAAILDVTQGPEAGSRYAAPTPARPYAQEVGRDPGKLRIAVMPRPSAGTPVAPECVDAVWAAARLCESLGHHVEEAAPKIDVGALGQASFAIIASSVAADLEDRSVTTGIAISPEVLEKVTLAFYAQGKKTSGMDVARAGNVMQSAAIAVAAFMEKYDIILSPTVASPPPKLGILNMSPEDIGSFFKNAAVFSAFTGLFNYTGAPSMSVPLSMSDASLPIGIMFSARYGDEATLFRLAGQLERAAPWRGRRPKVA